MGCWDYYKGLKGLSYGSIPPFPTKNQTVVGRIASLLRAATRRFPATMSKASSAVIPSEPWWGLRVFFSLLPSKDEARIAGYMSVIADFAVAFASNAN